MARILIVEDDPLDRELVQWALSEAKLRERTDLMSAHAAVALLTGPDGGGHDSPALVLLDLKMPGCDGFEVLRRVRTSSRARHVPIVILTSSRDDGDRRHAYGLGANGYIIKPESVADLVRLLRCSAEFWLELNLPPPIP